VERESEEDEGQRRAECDEVFSAWLRKKQREAAARRREEQQKKNQSANEVEVLTMSCDVEYFMVTLKPGFHYPSSRPELTARKLGCIF